MKKLKGRSINEEYWDIINAASGQLWFSVASLFFKKMIESFGNKVKFIEIEKGKDEALNTLCSESDIEKKKSGWIKTQMNRVKGRICGTKSRKMFSEFRNSTGLNSLCDAGQFDTCVIGSDEVFNCLQRSRWGFSPQLFGDVSSEEKVITYAASCGSTKVDNLSEELKVAIRKAMSKLSAISVRDKNTAELVQSVIGKEFVYNLDPVAVGNFDDEIRDATLAFKVPEKFCIVYSYFERFNDPSEIKAISDYCKVKGLEIIAPFGKQKWIPDYDKLSPFELLKAYQRAECIVTDTFHGTLFGAKFGKKMAVLIRESNRNKLVDLTQRLKIQDHVITDMSHLSKVLENNLDRNEIDKILRTERIRSMEYLKENL